MARILDAGNYLERTAAITNSATMSFSGWFYFPSTAAYYFAFRQQVAGGYRGLTFNGGGDTNLYAYSESATEYGQAPVAGIGINTWHHLGGVWNGIASRTAYLDGVGGTANTTSVTPVDQTYTIIGFGSAQTTRPAEVAVWDAVLTADEMAALGKGYSPKGIRPSSQVAYWPIMGRASPEPDVVGGLNLTVLGTDTYTDHPRIIYPRRRTIIRPPPLVAARPTSLITRQAVQRAASW